MEHSYILKTTGLSYHYSKNVQTLFDINLQIPKGSIYGFLGPNGSGKTTTLSLLLGLLPKQQGEFPDGFFTGITKTGYLKDFINPCFGGAINIPVNLQVVLCIKVSIEGWCFNQ